MRRSVWLFLLGQALSVIGDAFGSLAMGWLVYDLTGSMVAMGTLVMVGRIPEILVRLFGGPLIDRVSRSRLMAILNAVQCLAYLTPPVLAYTGRLAIWHLYLLSMVAGAAGGWFSPALMALVPSLVDSRQLVRVNAWVNGTVQLAKVIGPGLAGIVIASFGAMAAMAVDSVSFAISAATLLSIPLAVGQAASAAKRPGYRSQLADGFRFYLRVPALLLLMLVVCVSNLGTAMILTLMVPFVREYLQASPTAIGTLESAWAAGFIVGTFALGTFRAASRRPGLVVLGAQVAFGAANIGLGLLAHGVVPAAIFQGIAGIAGAISSTTNTAVYQLLVPGELRGRVSSLRLLLAWAASPLGAFLGAVLGGRIGIPATFAVAGLLPAVAALLVLPLPVMRLLDDAKSTSRPAQG